MRRYSGSSVTALCARTSDGIEPSGKLRALQMRDSRSVLAGVLWIAVAACGPGKRPPEGCDGPSFNLRVTAEGGPLPADTRINVHYGSNQEGEPYALGQHARKQAVFCDEETNQGGAPAGGDGGDGATPPESGTSADVWALRCRLYTQGPARVDITATGYLPIDDYNLPFADDDRCDVDVDLVLQPFVPGDPK